MTVYRRLGISIVLGAMLGVLCIIGVGSRLFAGAYFENLFYLMGMWYNRVTMGLVIGLAGGILIVQRNNPRSLVNAALRGLILGILISSAIYLSDAYQDLMSLFAGFAYGVVIDVVATMLDK